jgi:rhamnogalacturonan endolyase
VGDWREEVILPDATRLQDLKIFATWYPTTHKFPWLMTDHCYWMSALNENIGYNQPTNLGYYLGTDLKSDQEAWEQGGYLSTGILTVEAAPAKPAGIYNLMGQKLQKAVRGLYIENGKKKLKY